MTLPSKMSKKDFDTHIATARKRPLGWAVLAGTTDRAAVRVTVLCVDDGEHVWVQYRIPDGVSLELAPLGKLLHYVLHQPKEV